VRPDKRRGVASPISFLVPTRPAGQVHDLERVHKNERHDTIYGPTISVPPLPAKSPIVA
jgi:hypothetical protein